MSGDQCCSDWLVIGHHCNMPLLKSVLETYRVTLDVLSCLQWIPRNTKLLFNIISHIMVKMAKNICQLCYNVLVFMIIFVNSGHLVLTVILSQIVTMCMCIWNFTFDFFSPNRDKLHLCTIFHACYCFHILNCSITLITWIWILYT